MRFVYIECSYTPYTGQAHFINLNNQTKAYKKLFKIFYSSEVTLNPCQLLDLKHIPDLTVKSKYLEIDADAHGNLQTTTVVENSPLEKSILKRYIGIVLAISTSLIFSFITLFVKRLSARYHVFNVGLWRYISNIYLTEI